MLFSFFQYHIRLEGTPMQDIEIEVWFDHRYIIKRNCIIKGFLKPLSLFPLKMLKPKKKKEEKKKKQNNNNKRKRTAGL